ncbi:hypothetical protein IWZ03DRAFT_410471 [Phyllosticta citriasiana]|uniref:Uncharacterized protein n=1 Tax=Phyllosticta citriasiana TaxID=595635 RepID=A0ABR1KZL8_9PEZI
MVQYYQIAGRKVGSHVVRRSSQPAAPRNSCPSLLHLQLPHRPPALAAALSIGVLGTLFGGIALATGGSKAKKVDNTPPINASSKDEENFIQEFLKEAEGEKKH